MSRSSSFAMADATGSRAALARERAAVRERVVEPPSLVTALETRASNSNRFSLMIVRSLRVVVADACVKIAVLQRQKHAESYVLRDCGDRCVESLRTRPSKVELAPPASTS